MPGTHPATKSDFYIVHSNLIGSEFQNVTLKVLLVRNLSPNFQNSNGIGTIASAINPKTELPHPRPNASYIDGPARGSNAPRSDRSTVLAASAEAEWIPKASIR